jgi:biotin carboxylase
MSGRKTLWIVSGGIEALPGIEQAKGLGLHVVVSDGRPDAPGFALADDAVVASTYDVEETVAAAVRYHETVRPVDGVVCIASDVPVTVAAVAEALGLPGIPVAAARLATDKLAMKERFHADGVPVPWFSAVASAGELAAHAASGRPLIVKPVDSRGSRGVLRLTDGVDVAEAFETARSFSSTGRVMVEEFLTGPQVSTETIVVDGVAVTPGFSDRNYELLERYAPNVIENGGDQPSRLPDDQQAAVRELVGRAAASLGVRNGVVKGDIVVHGGRPYVIELAARLSGGWFCTHQIPLSAGVSTLEATIRLALGEVVDPAELEPRRAVPVAQRYVFPAPGEVVAVHGVGRAKALPGIEEVVVSARPGDVVLRPTDSNAAAGMVIAVGSSRAEARARAEAAVAAIHIETKEAA